DSRRGLYWLNRWSYLRNLRRRILFLNGRRIFLLGPFRGRLLCDRDFGLRCLWRRFGFGLWCVAVGRLLHVGEKLLIGRVAQFRECVEMRQRFLVFFAAVQRNREVALQSIVF